MGRKHNERVARVTSDNKVYWYDNAKEASQQCNIPYGTLAVACNGATVKYLNRLGWRFYFETDAPEWAKGELVERATESLETNSPTIEQLKSKLAESKAELELLEDMLCDQEAIYQSKKDEVAGLELSRKIVIESIDSEIKTRKFELVGDHAVIKDLAVKVSELLHKIDSLTKQIEGDEKEIQNGQ